jgi:predicted RNA-binding protein with PUA-like domain
VAKRYWLVKSDPATFGLPELAASPERTTRWDGVRNYQARNHLRDDMQPGDGVLFYHSQSDPPAVVATAKVVRAGYPDPTQFDRKSPGHEPRARPDQPVWYAVDIQLDEVLERPVPLSEMRDEAGLRQMVLLRKGSRLSVQPVSAAEWRIVTALGSRRPGAGTGKVRAET